MTTSRSSTLPADQRYSNLGYLLLGMAVEQLSGRRYYDWLRDAVLSPIGVHDVYVADSVARAPREQRYQCVNAVPSVLRPDLDPAWVSEPYGGLATEVTAASGGLLGCAAAVVTTIAHHAVWGMGPRSPGSSRIGNMPGTFTCASSRGVGLDWVVLFNSDDGLTDAVRAQFLSSVDSAVDALA